MDKQLGNIGVVVGVWALGFTAVGAVFTALNAHWAVWSALALFVLAALAALLMAQDPQSRDRLISILEDPDFRPGYRAVVVRPMRYFWRQCADPAPHGTWLYPAALTWKTYDLALRIAVAYPVILLIGPWLFWGGDVVLNGEVIQAGTAQWWQVWPERAALLGAFAILIFAAFIPRLASASQHRVFEKGADWLQPVAVAFAVVVAGAGAVAVAFAFAVVVAGAFAGAGAVAVAFAVAVAVVVAGAFAGAGAVVVAGAFAGAVAVAGAVAIVWLDGTGRPRLARTLLTCLLPVGWVIAALYGQLDALSPSNRMFFLFLGVFPLINALFDAVSYAATLALVRWGIRSRHWGTGLFAGLLDVLLAMVLFAALTVTLTAVVAGLSRLAGAGGDLLDLTALFADLSVDLWSHPWVPLMIASTLLPTGLHLCASLLAVQSFTPFRGRAVRLLGQVEQSAVAAITAPLLAGVCLVWPLLLGGGLLWGAVTLAMPWFATAGAWYMEQLLALAQAVAGA